MQISKVFLFAFLAFVVGQTVDNTVEKDVWVDTPPPPTTTHHALIGLGSTTERTQKTHLGKYSYVFHPNEKQRFLSHGQVSFIHMYADLVVEFDLKATK